MTVRARKHGREVEVTAFFGIRRRFVLPPNRGGVPELSDTTASGSSVAVRIAASDTSQPAQLETGEKKVAATLGTKIPITLLVDGKDCARNEYWTRMLGDIAKRNNSYEFEITPHSLTDQRAGGSGATALAPEEQRYFLENCKVLIINWDAINGDPTFGSHIPLHWFQVRRAEILTWVAERGGILIVEGQAVLSVPNQDSYDALFGKSEVSVSGVEDRTNPRAQSRRGGTKCKMTAAAQASPLFNNLTELTPDPERTPKNYEDMFPSGARYLLLRYLRLNTGNTLYRGWFRWNAYRRRYLPWVSLVKTADRRLNHTTLLGARHGKGAIFASTMFLASSYQIDLVEAMIGCIGQANSLPTPPRLSELFRRNMERFILPVITALVVLLLSPGPPVLQRFVWQPLQGFTSQLGVSQRVEEVTARLIASVVVALVFWFLLSLLRRINLWKFLEENVG